MGNRDSLIALGWRQGCLVKADDDRLRHAAHYDPPDDALLLVVSQTCDLVQDSFECEPYFEVLCLRRLSEEPAKRYLGGKNSRRIEFSLSEEDGDHWYALPHERHLIDREVLLEGLPIEGTIQSDQLLTMLLRWLSRRYTRTAFPEAFVSRLGRVNDKIAKKFARLNPHVSNVYVRVKPFCEVGGDSDYSMELLLLMDAQKYDDKEVYGVCEKIKNELETQIDSCEGILVNDVSIESTADLTIEELKGFLEWDYSYLSFRDLDDAAPPLSV